MKPDPHEIIDAIGAAAMGDGCAAERADEGDPVSLTFL